MEVCRPSVRAGRIVPVAASIGVGADPRVGLQIEMELRKYAPPSVTSLAVYGGVPIDRHYRALRQAPMIVIGTPGRLLDVAGTRHLDLRGVEYVVMDEADQMLDRGFLRDIQRILQLLPAAADDVVFGDLSPEIPHACRIDAEESCTDLSGSRVNSPTKITHAYYVVPSEALRVQLIHTLLQASEAGDQSMVFCDQKYKVKRLAARLGGEPASVGAITGNHHRPSGNGRSRHSAPDACAPGGDRCCGAWPGCAVGLAGHSLRVARKPHILRASCGTDRPRGTFRRNSLDFSPQEEHEYLAMVRRLRIQTKRLALPALAALPSST